MKSLYDSKATINFCYFKSWKCCRCSYKFCGNVEKKAQFSTALKTKIALEPEISKKKNKVEFKKEYKELFKLLKARECSLVNKTVLDRTKVCKNASDRTKNFKISENFTDLCNKENISQSELLEKPKNHEITEGIYTVKFTKPKKKKASSKKDSPDSNEENAKKLKRKKKKLSLKQENIKQVTKYSYDVHALKSYVEISINANEVEKTQIYLRKKMMSLKKKYKIETLGVDLYNLLISGWAKKGRLDKIKEVFSFMEEDQVSPNLQSYVGYLEGISNCKLKDINQMQQVIMDMKKKKNLCPEDILKKCVFKGDQREKVIEVLGFVGVDVFSDPIEIGDAYSCRLLQKLNAKSFGRGESFPNFGFQEKDIDSISSSQLEMESRFQLRIKSVDARTYLEKCENVWREEFTKSINKFKIEEKGSHAQNFYREDSIYPYISVIDTNILVNLMLQQVKALAEMGEFYNPSEKFIFKELGIKVMNHYFIWLNKTNKITDKVLLIYKEYLQYFLDKKLLAKYTPREYWEYLKQQNSKGPTIDITFTPWPHGVQVKIGSKLYSIMLQKVTFDENQVKKKIQQKFLTPGFYLHCESGFIDGEFRLSRNIGTHSLLCKLYRDAKLDYLEFDATLIPMLSPPKPWVKYDSGGFLITSTPFIRFNENAMHLNDFYSQVPPKNLNPCFDSLNSLSICPWTINKPVLDLIIDVFRKGGDEILDVPLNPNTLPPAPKVLSSMTQQERIIARGKKQEIRKKKCEASSLWYDCLYKLSIANHFRDEVFWFPHNLDFRGRTYPTPPHFNHLGSDLIRSILLFAEGQPLGKNGLDWLKIQLINLTGLKKEILILYD
ncbi:DNA-directed RNA polymerase, mitochondrial [Caerostris extrusa]|uniref:DNA-directed RNA polymerase, mitochondrial n=1 Tax=Caerostris extrusa TaxID=172846 RepID=A0AAV4R227_CAEEX|nr:DNA-directed RNA polymerase, mitochondrial [Caerostris extrusa]